MAVKFSDLMLAYDFASFEGGMGEHEAFVCKQTGKVYWRSEYDEGLDELPEDLEDNDQYLQIPDKHELDLGKRLVFRFVDEILPADYNKVREIFSRRGAYARFKDLLEYRGAVKQWYDFEAQATEQALRDWCEENGLEIDDSPPEEPPGPQPAPAPGKRAK